jgi:3-oxoacyl-[acyl-carrier protein] reductase
VPEGGPPKTFHYAHQAHASSGRYGFWRLDLERVAFRKLAHLMQSVIVTGGSRGLGLGIAYKLATAGYSVITVARRESEQLAGAMREVELAKRGSLCFRPCDLNDLAGIPDLVRELRKEFGAIYALVNNAALGTSGLLATTHDAQIERTVRLNTISPLILTKYVVRSMMLTAGGRIINIASIVGSTGYVGLSVYAATKAAIVGFTRSLARELGPLGINVNAVAPGFIDTDMTHGLGKQQREQVVRRSALHRLAEINDVANAVEFLIGDNARNITGTVLTVDAGSTA